MRVDPNYVVNLSSSLDQSSSALAHLSAEMSSGLRVGLLSDDPTAVAQSSLLNTAITQQDTYVQTALGETSRLQTADSALAEVVTQLTAAIGLAVHGTNGTLTASNLSTTQQQLSGVRDSIVSLGNTSYAGTYLFSGSQGVTKPFSIDRTTIPATTVYAGDANVQTIETPTGQSIQVSLPGSSILSGALTALNQLIADFSGPGVSATVAAGTAVLTAALGQVSTQRSILDSSLNKLGSSSSYAQTQAANETVAQRSLVTSDPFSVATELSANETQHQALLSVISGLDQQTNLFGYIK